jgi:glycosyltransferase involved in cell wall biosynthesis
MTKLSIIIPVYNEEKTLAKIVDRVQKVRLNRVNKELIIVNDASKDDSQGIIEQLKKKYDNIISFKHDANQGKGAAIRTGLKHFSGDMVVIQDGDLEYNPEDFKKMIKPVMEGKASVVYGSRLLGHITGFSIPTHYYGNKFLSFVTGVLYGARITDMETCYKMMTRDVAKSINLKSNRFDIEPEITVKILKKKHKILEIPIDYNCRTFEEGKKITWKDGIVAILTLFKYRFFD